MIRRKFMLATLTLYPFTLMANFKSRILPGITEGFRVKAGESRSGEHYTMRGVTFNTLDIKISGTDTDGNLAVFEQTGHTPEGGPPLHIHKFQDEWFYILEGEYLFQVGTEKYPMKAGDTIFLPRNIQHAFVQLTEKAKVIVSYQPAGKMESFFKITSEWNSPPSKEEIAKVFEEHDMIVVGPPLGSQKNENTSFPDK